MKRVILPESAAEPIAFETNATAPVNEGSEFNKVTVKAARQNGDSERPRILARRAARWARRA